MIDQLDHEMFLSTAAPMLAKPMQDNFSPGLMKAVGELIVQIGEHRRLGLAIMDNIGHLMPAMIEQGAEAPDGQEMN